MTLACAGASVPASARSAELRARLILPRCEIPGVSERGVRELLQVELYADGIRLTSAAEGFAGDDALLEVESSCSPDAPLTIRGSLGKAVQTRELGLADLPEHARTRALALSLAELVEQLARPVPPASAPAETAKPAAEDPVVLAEEASTVKPPPTAPPVAPPPKKPPERAPAPALPAGAPAGRPTRLTLAGELRWFAPDSPLAGARAGVEPGRFSFGLSLLAARAATDAGLVSATLVHGVAGFSLVDARSETGELAAGARIGFGLLALQPEPSAGALGSVSNDLYLDAALFGRARLALGSGFVTGVSAELGAARGAVAFVDALRVASYDGFLLGGLLELGYEP